MYIYASKTSTPTKIYSIQSALNIGYDLTSEMKDAFLRVDPRCMDSLLFVSYDTLIHDQTMLHLWDYIPVTQKMLNLSRELLVHIPCDKKIKEYLDVCAEFDLCINKMLLKTLNS